MGAVESLSTFLQPRRQPEALLKIRRQTQITILTERTLTVAVSGKQIFGECAECRGGTQMLSVDAAAKIARVNSLAIFRRLEAGDLHFEETKEGSLRVCSASLSAIEPENLEIKI